jgi:hypothetical protein
MNRKEFYNSLSDEVKEKIKACRSEEEMLKVLQEDRIELSPDLLEGVSGGNQNILLYDEDNRENKSFSCD